MGQPESHREVILAEAQPPGSPVSFGVCGSQFVLHPLLSGLMTLHCVLCFQWQMMVSLGIVFFKVVSEARDISVDVSVSHRCVTGCPRMTTNVQGLSVRNESKTQLKWLSPVHDSWASAGKIQLEVTGRLRVWLMPPAG